MGLQYTTNKFGNVIIWNLFQSALLDGVIYSVLVYVNINLCQHLLVH